jgi:hypothetical protein
LLMIGDDDPARNCDAVFRKKLLALIFVDFH